MSSMWAEDHAAASSTERGALLTAGQEKQREKEGGTGEER